MFSCFWQSENKDTVRQIFDVRFSNWKINNYEKSWKWILIVITLFYFGDIDIYVPYFSFMFLQCHLYPRLCLWYKWYWRAINEKVLVINNNTHKNSVIVIIIVVWLIKKGLDLGPYPPNHAQYFLKILFMSISIN